MSREEYLPFARPDFDGDEYREIREALEAGWVTSGPKTGHRGVKRSIPLGDGNPRKNSV